jgi:hypothetical protein
MLGKQGVGLVVTALVIIAISSLVIVFLVWFNQQSEWEAVQTTLSSWARHVPSGSAVVLVFKIALVAIFISVAI